MSWRLAHSLDTLRDEVRERFPGTTVWTIGDAAHRNRASDHNPNSSGVVCAIDVVGVEAARQLWNYLLGSKDERIKYLIFQGQIVSAINQPWVIRSYHGSNPHNDHIHVSVGRGRDGSSTRADLYDDRSSWGFGGTASEESPEPPSTPTTSESSWTETLVKNLPLRRRRTNLSSASVWDRRVQGLLVANGHAPRNTIDRNGRLDGKFGPGTHDAVVAFQRSARIGVDGIVGPQTWTKLLGR